MWGINGSDVVVVMAGPPRMTLEQAKALAIQHATTWFGAALIAGHKPVDELKREFLVELEASFNS